MAKKFLLVCTGNTCRSSMAAAILQELIKQEGIKDVAVDSAGIAAIPDAPAATQAQRVMARKGLDLSGHQAKLLTAELAQKADIIITMTQNHKTRALELLGSQGTTQVYTLGEFAQQGGDVSDPFGADEEEYARCAQEIKELLHLGIKQRLL